MKGNTKKKSLILREVLNHIWLIFPSQNTREATVKLLKQKGSYISVLMVLCPRWKLQSLLFSKSDGSPNPFVNQLH